MEKAPVIPTPYTPPPLMGNGHIQSIWPTLFRTVTGVSYRRERIATADDDFLDLDWAAPGHRRLAVVTHGLGGNSHRAYVTGMVKALNQEGWDALAWNCRGCSEEINLKLRFSHNGATDDLHRVICHAAETGRYSEIVLVGFSMGGNISLLHLGRDEIHPLVKRAVVFSVPCHLASGARVLARPSNFIYMKRFLFQLRELIRAKAVQFPGQISDAGYEEIRDFKDFDDRYTAPMHGFKDAEEYWEKCSSIRVLSQIRIPCLMVNALNDPFLARESYPVTQAKSNPHLHLITPASGGHVGFMSLKKGMRFWSEQAAVDFLSPA